MRFELTAEQQEFHDKVRAFADRAVRPRAALIDDTDDFPHDIVKEAGAFGLMGLPSTIEPRRNPRFVSVFGPYAITGFSDSS